MWNKKICLIIPSLQAGGMERVMSELAGYFSAKPELEIHLVLYGISPVIFYKIPQNITVHRPKFIFNNRFRIYYTLKTLLFLRKEISRINPDTILSFGEYWNSFVLLALLFKKHPIYISDRCQPNKSFGFFHNNLRRLIYPRATGIIAQTEKARQLYVKQFRNNKIEVIANPIREIKISQDYPKENIVLMVSRFIHTKHQDKLTELFLRINNPDWKLILVGYDHLGQNLSETIREIVKRHKAEDRVILTGKESDVDRYYSMSKIFAFTSSSEGFPNAIGEAMSAGLPVIAFDCVAGPSEMIEDGINGYLVPLFDYDLFQISLERLMRDEKLRAWMGNNARNSVRKFDVKQIGQRYLNFILGN